MIKAIFWDNDGILVDTERYYYQATKEVLATVEVDLTEELFAELLLKQAKGAWHLASEKGCTEEKVKELHQQRNENYLSMLKTGSLEIPNVRQVLEELHGTVQMSIVTSSLQETFATIHERTGFLEYMDFFLAKGDYSKSKPDPSPYLTALTKSGLKPEECVVIEDSQRGLIAAKAAGLACWVIPTELTKGQDFSQADKVLTSIAEVPPLIHASRAKNLLGILDLGSNSVMLTVGDANKNEPRQIAEFFRVTKLGDKVTHTNHLNEAAVERTLQAAQNFITAAKDMGVKRFVGTATSAVRDADNGTNFLLNK